MAMSGLSYANVADNDKNKYLYNGKELQEDFGLDWYDYGARFYDAQLGRWHVVDPMIEDHYDYTCYAYVYNNPMVLIDPLGMDTILIHVMTNPDTKLTKILDNAVSQMNKAYGNLNVDLHAKWKYIKSGDEMYSKEGFYNREGNAKNDSYVVMSYSKDYTGSAENLESKGWGDIWATNGYGRQENGPAGMSSNVAVVNLSNALVTDADYKFESSSQKLAMTTEHETGHTKFKNHPKSRRAPGVMNHITGTIMQKSINPKKSGHDSYMRTTLQKLHGKRYYENPAITNHKNFVNFLYWSNPLLIGQFSISILQI